MVRHYAFFCHFSDPSTNRYEWVLTRSARDGGEMVMRRFPNALDPEYRWTEVRRFLRERGEVIMAVLPDGSILTEPIAEPIAETKPAECPKCMGAALKAEEALQMLRLGKD